MKATLVTSAIPYVNAKPHVGHVVEMIQADVLARFYREQGRDVFQLAGTDENSLKNVRAAQEAGQPIEAFVAEHAGLFQEIARSYNLALDAFIRTTEDRHTRGAQKLWQAMREGDIYRKPYTGLYCVGCEEFKLEKDLVDGLCPDHQTAPEQIEEENYFFKLSAYQKELEELIASDTVRVVPEFRKNEVLSFIRSGLEDFSISRSQERAEGWGVPVPGDPTQIMYVWVDALSNYINALDYADDGELFRKFWSEESDKIHMIGKGITRFHAIYWVAMLRSAGLPLPTTIFVHEYFTVDGKKMSKSLGNVIDPQEIVDRFGADAARYLLLTALPYGKDGDISWAKLIERYNADLANSLGNLVQRTLVLRQKFDVIVAPGAKPTCADVDRLTEAFQFEAALSETWKLVAQANGQLEAEKPWSEPDADKRTQTLMSVTRQLETIAACLKPYLPETSQKIAAQLASGEPQPLFPRLA